MSPRWIWKRRCWADQGCINGAGAERPSTCSACHASCSTRASAKRGPAICKPTGRPPRPLPQAAVPFGLTFGPETPASTSVLARLATAARRPWIFSVRQAGNQAGAMTGSILLPALLTVMPQLPYLFVAVLAVAVAAWCVALSRHADLARATHSTEQAGVVTAKSALKRVLRSRALRSLALATLCYTAVQMCLNTFLMSLAVREWRLGVAQAAGWVAALQAAGLCGRLFWGWLAQRTESSARLLGGIGLAMAGAGIALMASPALQLGAISVLLVLLLGFSASGWNGVLVAEVARIAGAREDGTITGAVLMFGYAGLTLAPLTFAALSNGHSMVWAFTVLFACAGAAGAVLVFAPAKLDAT